MQQGDERAKNWGQRAPFEGHDYAEAWNLAFKIVQQTLDSVYDAVLQGIPDFDKPVEELADAYLEKHGSPRAAARALVRVQAVKCGASGLVTGIGGVASLPIALSADLVNELYVQARMVAAIARLGGLDVRSQQVRGLVFRVFSDCSTANVLKNVGVQVGNTIALTGIRVLPGTALARIGGKGAGGLGRLVPVIGGAVSGGLNIAATRAVGLEAIERFLGDEPIPTKLIERVG